MEKPVHSNGVASSDQSRETLSDEKSVKPASAGSVPRLCAAVSRLDFARLRRKLIVSRHAKFNNNLLGLVGLLELANAADFAANVWNEVPVPRHAIALMALGGSAALIFSIFGFRDAKLSWDNIGVLREQRRRLRRRKAERLKESLSTAHLDALLDVTFRELGCEAINRYGMDILLGSGAIVIGVGTLMAIDGGNPNVWQASNLLTGYIGNSPIALYGLVNLTWAVYLWRKAGRHRAAAGRALGPAETPASTAIRQRASAVQAFSVLSSLGSILGGAGSLMTATMWYGYVLLVPAIILSIVCNIFWRRVIGYDRVFFADGDDDDATTPATVASLVRELDFAVWARRELLEKEPAAALAALVADPDSLPSVVDFLVANDLLDDLGAQLCRDQPLLAALLGPAAAEEARPSIEAARLLAVPEEYHCRILECARLCVREKGPKRFRYRQLYLAESLGSFLGQDSSQPMSDRQSTEQSQVLSSN